MLQLDKTEIIDYKVGKCYLLFNFNQLSHVEIEPIDKNILNWTNWGFESFNTKNMTETFTSSPNLHVYY